MTDTIATSTPAEPATPETPSAATAPETPVKVETPPEAPPASAEPQTPEPTAEPETPPAERVVPEADGYVLPEGVPPVLGEFANKNGFTQEQLDATIAQFGEYSTAAQVVQQTAIREQGEALIKEWGNNAQYNLSLAKRALKQNDTTGELAKVLNESGYGNHPAVLTFLSKLGKDMQEGGFLKSSVTKPKGAKTMAQRMFPNMPSTEA